MQNEINKEIKLTEYAHGAGCGCKIAPQVLSAIIGAADPSQNFPRLLVGNKENDDAAVYELGNGTALIATADFFMPIVDDPFDFGCVAAANAISDVYAMGGTPSLALALLGWPVDKLAPELAAKVIEGARSVCAQANIPLAGGHSIDTTEPMFGLSVNGLVNIADLKKNSTANEGDYLFLTKPLGSGILSTARKRKLLREEDETALIQTLKSLNVAGEKLGKIKGVTAMTDVTGFGLLGHLTEMCKGSGNAADLYCDKIRLMPGLKHYIKLSVLPDATYRNWNAYSKEINIAEGVDAAEAFMVLPDPQTNGGLLFTVHPESVPEVVGLLRKLGLADHAEPIGRMKAKADKLINLYS